LGVGFTLKREHPGCPAGRSLWAGHCHQRSAGVSSRPSAVSWALVVSGWSGYA